MAVSHPILNWETHCLYLKKLSTKCKYQWSVWDIQVQPQSNLVYEDTNQTTEKHSRGLMNRYHNFLLCRRRRWQELTLSSRAWCWWGKQLHRQRASITLSPIPQSLEEHDQLQNQPGISKSHAWAELSSQGQLRGDVLPNFLTAFIGFNSSCPTYTYSMG